MSQRKYKNAADRWESLRAKMETHAHLLVGQGDLVLKKIGSNHYCYLRFLLPADEAGRRRHCSVYVGREYDVKLVERVRAKLDDLRLSKRRLEEIAGCVRLAAMLNRVMRGAQAGLLER